MKFKTHNILGEINADWNVYKFSDVAELVHGYQFRTDDFTKSGVKVFKITQIKDDGTIDLSACDFIDSTRIKDFEKNIIKQGDILMALTGATIGKIARYNSTETVLQNYRVGNFTSKSEEILNKDFLYYFLKSKLFFNQLLARQTQSAQQNIGKEDINNMSICLPDIVTQRTIAKILCSIDSKIENNQRINNLLDGMAMAIYKEWFVDFNFPNRTGKFQETEIGKIPFEWRVGKLGDIVEVKGGTTPSTTKKEYWDGEYSWTSPKDLSSLQTHILLETSRKVTAEGVKQISSGILPKGTLLLSSRAPIGYLAISEIPISINQGFIAINGTKVSNLFMLYWLKENMQTIINYANGSTFLEISKSVFRNIDIGIPSNEALKSFEEIISGFYNLIVKNEKESRALVNLRDNLLPKLIKGEIEMNG